MILGLIPTLIGIPVSDNTALTPGANATALLSPSGACPFKQGTPTQVWKTGAHAGTQVSFPHTCSEDDVGCNNGGTCVDGTCVCEAAIECTKSSAPASCGVCDSLAGSGISPPANKWGSRYCHNMGGTASTFEELQAFDAAHGTRIVVNHGKEM